MKISIFILFITFFASALNAQDSACQKLVNLMSLQKDKKQGIRTISKLSMNNMVSITEIDTFGNLYTIKTMLIKGKNIKIEYILFCDKSYVKNDDGEWALVDMDFNLIKTMKNAAVRQQKNNIFQNCQQLPDEFVNGEKCFTFMNDTDHQFAQIEGNNEPIKAKNKMWFSENGLLRKMEVEIPNISKIVASDIIFEYDSKILIIEPKITKNGLKDKN